ncbi:hypothetical protein THRCLA_06695 [Thraustotheca clavata]|uniref:B9 domain-containing protein 2 n=1 Tax=Thraustotheca clavata TaxID=74557 RepID=A0A1V9ZKL9_9STRA|nr:hypothetical protein THRCLA_06695 [Thraustotheca clavata]
MPQVHVLGEIIGGAEYDHEALYCTWRLVKDDHYWSVIRGQDSGQTHLAMDHHIGTLERKVDVIWAHPLDIHLATSSPSGWPKIVIEVWHQDQHHQKELNGYGCCRIPSCTGTIVIECPTWRPIGNASSWSDRLSTLFFGAPRCVDRNIIHTGGINRYELCTESTGYVLIEFQVLLSGWTKQIQFH